MTSRILWAALWHSTDDDGRVSEHLIHVEGIPALFLSRQAARAWITKNYGYIRDRKDLRHSPHNWRVPKPVRVQVGLLSDFAQDSAVRRKRQ